jgi:isoleucyl-tRNA synthetase
MSTKFTEYKGLDLPTVASEVILEERKHEQSVTTREAILLCVLKVRLRQMDYRIHHVMARAIKDIFCRYKTQKDSK